MYRTLGVACIMASVFSTARLHAQRASLVIDARATARVAGTSTASDRLGETISAFSG
jgi:hypothetical protein